MSEYITKKCERCGCSNTFKVGYNYTCRACSKSHIWKDEDFFDSTYVEKIEDEEIPEETFNELEGDMYDYKEEE